MPDLMPEITAVLLFAAVALWASFAFILGPALWKTKRRASFFDLVVAGVAYGWLLTHFLASGWLGQPENATTVQAIAAAAQAFFAVALIVLTVRTVQASSTVAEETRVMARETEKMAAAVQQQRAATRPVLVFRLWATSDDESQPDAESFRVEVINVGAGPALETFIRVNGPPLRFRATAFPLQPAVITPADPIPFEFLLDKDEPFVEENELLRWTPDAELER
jgi:hypothetical protein